MEARNYTIDEKRIMIQAIERMSFWGERRERKYKNQHLDKRRAFFKWLVLAKRQGYTSVIDTVLKNSKFTQSKAAYILWKVIIPDKEKFQLTELQKRIIEGLYRIKKVADQVQMKNNRYVMDKLINTKNSPLMILFIKYSDLRSRIGLKRLRTFVKEEKVGEGISRLNKIIDSKRLGGYDAFSKLHSYATHLKEKTSRFCDLLERLILRKREKRMREALKDLKSHSNSSLRLVLAALLLQNLALKQKNQTFQKFKDLISRQIKSQQYGTNILKKLHTIMRKYQEREALANIKDLWKRKLRAAELLCRILRDQYSRAKKNGFDNFIASYRSFNNYQDGIASLIAISRMSEILELKVRSSIIQVLARPTKIDGANTLLRLIESKQTSRLLKANKILEKQRDNWGCKRDALNLMLQRMKENKRSGFQKLISWADKCQDISFIRRLNDDELIERKIAGLKNLDKLFQRHANIDKSFFFRATLQIIFLKLQVIKSLQNSSVMKLRDSLNILRSLLSDSREESLRKQHGLSNLSSLLNKHSDQLLRMAFLEIKRNSLDYNTYKDIALQNLFNRFMETDKSILRLYYQKLRDWNDLKSNDAIRNSKLKYLISKTISRKFRISRSFDIWRRIATLEDEFEKNNLNWSVSLQYSRGLDWLDRFVMNKLKNQFNVLRSGVEGSGNPLQKIITHLIAKQELKLFKAFGILEKHRMNIQIRLSRISSVIEDANSRYKDRIRMALFKWKVHVAVKKIQVFTKVIGNKTLKQEFDKLILHNFESAACDAIFAYKFDKLISALEKNRVFALRSTLIYLRKSNRESSKRRKSLDIISKLINTIYISRVKASFAVLIIRPVQYNYAAFGGALDKIEGLFCHFDEMSQKNGFSKISATAKAEGFRLRMREAIRSHGAELTKSSAIQTIMTRLNLALRGKLQDIFSKLIKNSYLEGFQSHSMIERFSKLMGMLNRGAQGKLYHAFYQLKLHNIERRRFVQFAAERLRSVLDLKSQNNKFSAYSKLSGLAYRRSKLASAFIALSNAQHSKSLISLHSMAKKKTRAQLIQHIILHIDAISRRRFKNSFRSILERGDSRALSLQMRCNKLSMMLRGLFRKQFKQSLDSMKHATGFELGRDEILLTRVLLQSERRFSSLRSYIYSKLKYQNLIRDISLVYYIGTLKLANLFKRNLYGGFYSIKVEERFQSYRYFYNAFWKWKVSSLEAKLFSRKLQEKKNQFWGSIAVNKSLNDLYEIFNKRTRSAVETMKEVTCIYGSRISSKDYNSIIGRTAKLAMIIANLQRKRLLLLSQSLSRWRQFVNAIDIFENPALYVTKYSRFYPGYKKWAYAARLIKVLDRVFAKPKINTFNQIYKLDNGEIALLRGSRNRSELEHLRFIKKVNAGTLLLSQIVRIHRLKAFYGIILSEQELEPEESVGPLQKGFRSKYLRNASGTRLVQRGELGLASFKLMEYVKNIGGSNPASELNHKVLSSGNISGNMSGIQYQSHGGIYNSSKTTTNIHSSVKRTRKFIHRHTDKQNSSGNQTLKLLCILLRSIVKNHKLRTLGCIKERAFEEEINEGKDNLERVKASYIDMVLKRGAVKILRNHRETQREALFRIFQNIEQ